MLSSCDRLSINAEYFLVWLKMIEQFAKTLREMMNEVDLEKICRLDHRSVVMMIKAQRVRGESDPAIVLRETQPHVVIFPAEPADLAQFVIIAAESSNMSGGRRKSARLRPNCFMPPGKFNTRGS
jgi:hypothetical protein